MRIDPFGIRHNPVKQDETAVRASIDMNLKKEKSAAEQRSMHERAWDEASRDLSEKEAKARAAAGGQTQIFVAPEARRQLQRAIDLDNLLRQAMIAAAVSYEQARDRMLIKAAPLVEERPGLVGLQSGDGPLFELWGMAADPTWRLGRRPPPQRWDVSAIGEDVLVVDLATGQIRFQWEGSRFLAQALRAELDESPLIRGDLLAIRWLAHLPSLDESASELFEAPTNRLDTLRMEAARRFNEAMRRRNQASLREQPPPSPEMTQNQRICLGIREGKLVPIDLPHAPIQELPEEPPEPPSQPSRPTTPRDRMADYLELRDYGRASELLLLTSSTGGPALELLKLARDHLQEHGKDVSSELMQACRRVIEEQKKARSGGA